MENCVTDQVGGNSSTLLMGESRMLRISPEPFNAAAFMGRGWRTVSQDEHSFALTEIDLMNGVEFVSCLKEGELWIPRTEKLKRLKWAEYICLDARAFLALYKEPSLIPESWPFTLEDGVTEVRISFDGTILSGHEGDGGVLILYKVHGELRQQTRSINVDCWKHDLSAVVPRSKVIRNVS